jgi:hypothetical protein
MSEPTKDREGKDAPSTPPQQSTEQPGARSAGSSAKGALEQLAIRAARVRVVFRPRLFLTDPLGRRKP